jgi:hypothetical protein
MRVDQLREQLADLRRKEVIAQTREQLLNEEKQKLLAEVSELFVSVKTLGVISDEELTPGNLSAVVDKLQAHIDAELAGRNIPQELL